MQINILTKDELVECLNDWLENSALPALKAGQNADSKLPEILHSKDVCALLNISDNTLRKLRNNRDIPYTRPGKTYLYERAKILDHLAKKSRPAK